MRNLFKKNALLFLIAFIFVSAAQAQNLRDYVCIVRGNISEENKAFLEKLSDSLEKYGYKYYAKYVDSFMKGTFGSGFIWYAPDGKPYIVTNRHVVRNYESVNLTFENEDGSVSEFKELKVVFADDEVDLALVALPATFKKEGLLFTSKKVTDGDDVFSAGFPGLGGEPSWQFGKGVVSNSAAKIKALLNPEISTLIQHTAQIDGGNSGGPLLVKDSSVKAGYKICGVNTWTAVARQNTNFSIPVDAVESTIKKNYIKKEKTSFDASTLAFIKAVSVKDDFTDTVNFVSNEMISKYGEKALRDVLGKSSNSVRTFVSDVFEANPIEGLRYAVAYGIYEKINSDERIDIASVEDETTGKKVNFTVADKTYSSFWIEDQGAWKLSEFDGINAGKKLSEKEKARNQNGSIFSMEDPFVLSFGGGYARNLTEGANGFDFEVMCRLNYFAFGGSVFMDTVTAKKSDEFSSDPDEVKEYDTYNVGPFVQLRLPMRIDTIVLMPFVEGRAGISLSEGFMESDMKPFFAGFAAGFEFAFCSDSACSPFIGAKFLANKYLGTENDLEKNIVIFAGIKMCDK